MSKVIELINDLTCTSCGAEQRGHREGTCPLCGGKLTEGDPHPWAVPTA